VRATIANLHSDGAKPASLTRTLPLYRTPHQFAQGTSAVCVDASDVPHVMTNFGTEDWMVQHSCKQAPKFRFQIYVSAQRPDIHKGPLTDVCYLHHQHVYCAKDPKFRDLECGTCRPHICSSSIRSDHARHAMTTRGDLIIATSDRLPPSSPQPATQITTSDISADEASNASFHQAGVDAANCRGYSAIAVLHFVIGFRMITDAIE